MINKLLNKMNYETKLTIFRIGMLAYAIGFFLFGLNLMGVIK